MAHEDARLDWMQGLIVMHYRLFLGTSGLATRGEEKTAVARPHGARLVRLFRECVEKSSESALQHIIHCQSE